MSSGGGKAPSSGQKSYNYYGSLMAVENAGLVDTLYSRSLDGKEIWSGPINADDVSNPYPLVITDPKWIRSTGYMNFYWGGQTAADALVPDGPPYRDFSYSSNKLILFGREKTNAPNIEDVIEVVPVVPTSIISSTSLYLHCANPFAVLAFAMTSTSGAMQEESLFDAASWQDAHDFLAATVERKNLTYIAPLLNSQEELRSLALDVMNVCDGWLRNKSDGTIEAGVYDVDPGSLSQYTTITANELTKPIRFHADTWDDVPTGVVVTFTDGDRQFKRSSEKVVSQIARLLAGQERVERLDLERLVTRRDQALAIGAEWCKRNCVPKLRDSIIVRREKAVNPDDSPLRPGDRFLLDVNLEPGGTASLQLCRVLKRRFGVSGPMTIDFESEPNQPQIPFTPSYTSPQQSDIEASNIEEARVIAVPPELSPEGSSVWILASRPDDLIDKATVLFDVNNGAGTFAEIAIQRGFAVHCQVAAHYADDVSSDIRVRFLQSRDRELALVDVGESGALNNELLLFVLKSADSAPSSIDFVDENSLGEPILEIFSIQTYTAVEADVYDFTVLRSVMGTMPFTWDDGDEAWIIPKASLSNVQHENFPAMALAGDEAILRLRSGNKWTDFDGMPNDFPFRFPPAYNRSPKVEWVTPGIDSYEIADDGDFTPEANITDADGNLVRVVLFSTELAVAEEDQTITTHLDVTFTSSNSKTLSNLFTMAGTTLPLNFGGVSVAQDTYWQLTIRAIDDDGASVEDFVTLFRPQTGGGGAGLTVPTIGPDQLGGGNHRCNLSAVAPATRIASKLQSIGDPPPAGNGSVQIDLDFNVSFLGSRRLYARSSADGVTWSAWVYRDVAG